ncbi:MAG: adenosylhomocysteinase [Candidatus Eisenbacteria bacterium]|nr:adenosylhomocysteinase [Candidatus Eisenbacteria bacterium]
MQHDIADAGLAGRGADRTEWAAQKMPVLRSVAERFERERPLEGMVIGGCLHVTTETANLMITLKAGGARPSLCASNPLSTQDDVAAHLTVDHDIPVFAVRGEDNERYYSHIRSVLDLKPSITLDDGADLVSTIHTERRELIPNLLGSMEETTTGVIRLRAMEKDGALEVPVIAVNDANTKHMFDNRYGTGQSTIDGILRATNTLVAGSVFVIAGYGWCGRGLAFRARGMGASVVITEVDPLRALEAVMDGFRVAKMDEVASVGDIFVTVTGDINVLVGRHFEMMKDGAVVANSGHFDVEIDKEALKELAREVKKPRESVETYVLAGGKRVNLLGEGRLVNLSAAEGHPAAVMDMSFANQALCCEYLAGRSEGDKLDTRVHSVPEQIDAGVAALKLASMGVAIDELTPEQREYLASWEMGT